MILNYPTTSPTVTVTLPDPDLGNSLRVDTNAVIRRTRSGELKSVDNWHDVNNHSFKISTMDATERSALETFILATNGLEISLEFNSQVWYGYILNSTLEIITLKDDCSYDMAFDFRGRRIS